MKSFPGKPFLASCSLLFLKLPEQISESQEHRLGALHWLIAGKIQCSHRQSCVREQIPGNTAIKLG